MKPFPPKIYTRKGDQGETQLGNGTSVAKDDERIEVCGTLDELNSTIGMVLAHPLPVTIHTFLATIQHELFELGGEFSHPSQCLITADHVTRLEKMLDDLQNDLPPLTQFILPQGSLPIATCQVARTVCRRVERRVVSLNHTESVNPYALAYLNRLSDLLFVIARTLTKAFGETEVVWKRQGNFEKFV